MALPLGSSRRDILLTSPKTAVAAAERRLGVELADEVELVGVPYVYPQFARWRVTAAQPVEVTRRGATRSELARTFYFGWVRGSAHGVLAVAVEDQSPISMEYFEPPSGEGAPTKHQREIPIREGLAVDVSPLQSGVSP
jgi:hypothetical protein